MGAYLSEPITEKHSVDEELEHITYGASSMQGWRLSQEDAHNCIPEFDDKTSLFAVYDGHGGSEVAQYCSMYFPDYLKNNEAYRNGNMAQALEDAFLGFDETLVKPSVVKDLKAIAGVDDDEEEDDEEDKAALFEEATMPLEELLARYGGSAELQSKKMKNLQGLSQVKSPMLRGKQPFPGDNDEGEAQLHNGSEEMDGCIRESKGKGKGKRSKVADVKAAGDSEVAEVKAEASEEAKPETDDGESETKLADCPAVAGGDQPDSTSAECEAAPPSAVAGDSLSKEAESNCEDAAKADEKAEETPAPSSSVAQKSEAKDSGNEAASASAEAAPSCVSASSADADEGASKTGQRSAAKTIRDMILKAVAEAGGDDEDEDEEFVAKEGEEEDDEDEDDDYYDEEMEEEEEEEAEEEEEEDEAGDGEEAGLFMPDREMPGMDSGCTAVVCLIHGDELYVANAGDSRCVVCRAGKAIDMSVDHKPEDELEKTRIKKAGGRVTAEGRVNGGLNLSRAIGDHAYKKNKKLALKDQMITSLPDIRTLSICEDDEFIVVACDGIWNSMTSQEVVDFIKEKFKTNLGKLAPTCENLFDACIASDTSGDGTGCDNMTTIIVTFNHAKLRAVAARRNGKRASVEADSNDEKRARSGGDDERKRLKKEAEEEEEKEAEAAAEAPATLVKS
ncbi:PREDICTED: probable protein phosphatase CG10417 [Priapulus caudatus]|uniref:protein-serine/threonine phosphatase n=1 Tax=Priapulus caudatus TaxID=37621 RepID=A0ABM1EMK7_PRICU|nr:PREDICTED: probable protein phosphatase CG10417 [Priapulus caudatus]